MGACSSKGRNGGASAGGPTGDYGGTNGADVSPASSKGGGGDLRYNMLKASKGDRFHETYEVGIHIRCFVAVLSRVRLVSPVTVEQTGLDSWLQQ